MGTTNLKNLFLHFCPISLGHPKAEWILLPRRATLREPYSPAVGHFSILYSWPSDASDLRKAFLMEFGFTGLTGRGAANRSFRNGQTMVQVTDLRGGTEKAEAAKLQDAGISPKQGPRKCVAEKGWLTGLEKSRSVEQTPSTSEAKKRREFPRAYSNRSKNSAEASTLLWRVAPRQSAPYRDGEHARASIVRSTTASPTDALVRRLP